MNEFLKEILPIGVILTFFATMYSIYYTRKNLKTTKYIDTITSERIKWLEIIRNEVSEIVTNVYFTLKIYSEDLKNKENEIKDYENDIEVQMEEQERIVNSYIESQTSSALGREMKIWSQSDFIKNLFLFKIRLNSDEDKKIIEVIDYFIKFYAESEYKSENEIPIAREKVKLLITQIQILLKHEWEKIKNESKGKIINNKKVINLKNI